MVGRAGVPTRPELQGALHLPDVREYLDYFWQRHPPRELKSAPRGRQAFHHRIVRHTRRTSRPADIDHSKRVREQRTVFCACLFVEWTDWKELNHNPRLRTLLRYLLKVFNIKLGRERSKGYARGNVYLERQNVKDSGNDLMSESVTELKDCRVKIYHSSPHGKAHGAN